MRLVILLISTVFLLNPSFGQNGLPAKPEPGKCYIRCITENKWKNEEKKVMVTPAYKKLEVIPAEYKDVEEEVLIKPATKRYEYIPAVFRTVIDTVYVIDPYNEITVNQVKLVDDVEDFVYQPAFAQMEWRSDIENCKSKDPRNCMVLCYVEYPEQKTPIPTKRVEADASYSSTPVKGKFITLKREEVVTPAQVKEIEIPAQYKTIKRKVLVKDETVRELNVDAVYRTETTRILEEVGGMEVWEEIECKLTDMNVLPIFYELGSARLTQESKSVIDEKLYKLMINKPFIRIELASHTDSRGSKEANLDLSQRRAQSVVDYLVAKGIDRDRLIATGYGESRLVNKCADGVDCTEGEHAQNRRTEFRVLTN